jgi:hypothetical protein
MFEGSSVEKVSPELPAPMFDECLQKLRIVQSQCQRRPFQAEFFSSAFLLSCRDEFTPLVWHAGLQILPCLAVRNYVPRHSFE